MINPAKSYTVEEYIEIFRRRMWHVIIPFLVVIIGTLGYLIFAPRYYKASTLILVSPQRVPEAFVQATVTSKVEERLQSIAQEVMSRTRLEQIINEQRLYENKKRSLSTEEIVSLMQNDIKIELPTKKEEKNFFTISYINSNPNVATTVANRLASLFIEENLKIREQQAVGTTEFLSNELYLSKEKLDEMEKAVAEYKKRFIGELPEQRESNIKILEQLQNQYQRVGENLRAAQDRKIFIQKQMSDMETGISISSNLDNSSKSSQRQDTTYKTATDAGMNGGGGYESTKEGLTRYLEDLESKYKESHPDIIAVKKKIADMEKKKSSGGYSILKKDPRYLELKNQLMAINLEIKRFAGEERLLADQMGKYRDRIERTPAREQDMASLLRQYQSTKETYEGLLKKSQDAQQAENLEKRQKGEQFRVIDPARVPEKPFSPDILKVILIGLFAGIFSGFGLAFIREQMDRSFHDVGDAESALGLKVLAIIPRIGEKSV